jgi:hypothetical protein
MQTVLFQQSFDSWALSLPLGETETLSYLGALLDLHTLKRKTVTMTIVTTSATNKPTHYFPVFQMRNLIAYLFPQSSFYKVVFPVPFISRVSWFIVFLPMVHLTSAP